MATAAFESLRASQLAWARASGIVLDARYRTPSLEENLFQALHPLSRTEFADGKGEELGRDGLPGKMWSPPPHLDVELAAAGHRPIAIEAKLAEPYRKVTNEFRPAYFERRTLWSNLPRSLGVAQAITSGELSFQRLHAAQLIKHALGLTTSHGKQGFALIYLWYPVEARENDIHIAEISDLQRLIEMTLNCDR